MNKETAFSGYGQMNPHFIFRDSQVSRLVKFGIYPNINNHKYSMSKYLPYIRTVTLKKIRM